MDRSERTVVTTGANSGIGLVTAVAVAEAGFRSVGTVRTKAKGKALKAAATDAGVEVTIDLLDVTDADACAEVVERHRPWGIVNNAGYSNTGAIEDITDEQARHQLETMAVAPMRLARLALPAMREQGGGRIVNVSSLYGRATTPLSGWYQASKHALEAASDALRIEVARDGVHVVLVEPGGFKTGIWEEMAGAVGEHDGSAYAGAYGRSLQMTKLAQPLMGEPRQVAKVIIRALTSPQPRARYLVGVDAMAMTAAQQLIPASIRDRVLRLGLGL